MTEPCIHTRFSLNWDEYYAAWRFLKRHSSEYAPEKIAGVTLMLMGIAIWMLGGHGLFVIVGVITGLMAIISVPMLYSLGLRHRWAREPQHQAEHQVSFSEREIHYLQGTTESHLNWEFYERLLESDEAFLLICGEDVFSLIPKRAFESEEAVSEFRALAAKKLRRR
ncbi:MAG TPA: YcxB family protein [Blastocatellia bacterium]|nr:YcxB family protein [Blastocatellia bacterium]